MKLYKKIFIASTLLAVVSLFIFNSCKKIGEFSFSIPILNEDIKIDSSMIFPAPKVEMMLFSKSITQDLEKIKKDYNAGAIKKVEFEPLYLSTSESSLTFSWLKSIRITISRNNQPELQIANKTDIDPSLHLLAIPIEVNNDTLKSYMNGVPFEIKVYGDIEITPLTVPSLPIHLNVKNSIRVTANLLE